MRQWIILYSVERDTSVPLTSEMLAQANPSQQKQMIGERIFPKIQQREPKLAGKITGMLLEMDNMELLHHLENEDALMVIFQNYTSVKPILQSSQYLKAFDRAVKYSGILDVLMLNLPDLSIL